jgi:hypothetical protein
MTLVDAGVTKTHRHDGIVGGVAEDAEAVFDEFLKRFERADGIGQQGLLVTEHLEFHPLFAGIVELFEDLAAEARHAHRILGGEAARGVGQHGVAIGVDEIQQRAAVGIEQAFTPDRHGNHLGARDVQGLLHTFVGVVLAGADDQAVVNGHGAELKRFVRELRGVAGQHGSMVPVCESAAAHERNDFHLVAVVERAGSVLAFGDE